MKSSFRYELSRLADFIGQLNPLFRFTVILLLLIALVPKPNHRILSDPMFNTQHYVAVQTMPQSRLEPVSEASIVYVNKLRPSGTYANTYAPGNCTFYDASRLPIPNNWGNANTWDDNARAQGYKVSATPIVGSIAQTDGDSYLGHVAIVESVNPDGSFVISEMNALGYGVVDSRLTNTGEFANFIYV